jgi:hypothetical protein
MQPKRVHSVTFRLIGRKLKSDIKKVDDKLIETKRFEVFRSSASPVLKIKASSPDGAFDIQPAEVQLATPAVGEFKQTHFWATPTKDSGVHKMLFTIYQRSAQLLQLNADVTILEVPSETNLISSSSIDVLEIPGINKRYVIRATYHGGMGLVHKIEDLSAPGQYIAAKTYFEKLPTSTESVNAFYREAMNWLGLPTHPNIVRVFLVARIGNKPYVLCEFIEGESLRDILVRVGQLPTDQSLSIVKQVCGALHHAHTNGLVHRDVKPENILIRADGVVKLTDLGVATAIPDKLLTESAELKGTIPYMAPELFMSGVEWDQRIDVYSVGVILYEMLAGKRPPECEDLPTKLSKKAICQFPSELRIGLPREFDQVVAKCLAPEASMRYSDTLEISRLLSSK